jgi:DNA-binding MarR family transcriptional regulator
MAREEHPDDRRRLKLAVTRRGLSTLEASRNGTLAYLSAKLSNVSGEERELIVGAMGALRSIFSVSVPREA